MFNPYLQAFSLYPFPSLILVPRKGDFIIQDANNSYCDLWKISREDIIGKKYPFYPEYVKLQVPDQEKKIGSVQKVLKTGRPGEVKLLQVNLQGCPKGERRRRFWDVHNIPLKNDAGEVVQILNIAIDETKYLREKQEIHDRLSVNHQEYENFVRKNIDGLYSLDREGDFLNVNEGLGRMAELPQEELLKMNFLPFCAPHDRERTLDHFRAAIEGREQIFEADFISATGKMLVLEITLIPMKNDGKISGAYGIAKDKTPVKEKETEFFKIEKKLNALVHEGSELVGILAPDGTYKFVSDTVRKILGSTPEDYIGKNAFDFIHPNDKERVMADFSLLGNNKQVKINPFRFRDGKGEWRWMETFARNFLDDPYVEGIVANSREVTDLVEKNLKIKQLFERYTLAAEATEDVIYDWDLVTDEVIRFHKSNEKLFGYSRKEIDAANFWRSNIHPEDSPGVLKNLHQHLEDPQQHHIRSQYRFRRADGSYAQIIDRSSIVRNENAEAVRLIGATLDVSEIVRNKEALKMANKRFSYAMKATKEMIWDWDITKRQIKRSTSFKKMFGYGTASSPSVEKFWFERIVEKDREKIRESLYAALNDPTVKKWREEYCFKKKDGDEAFVIDRGYILRNKNGEAIRMVGAVLDVTESRRMIREIQKQNQVLKEVAWEQAHVVRAPLARLKGLVGLLEEESYEEEWSRDEIISLIKSSADEVDEVIENIVRKTEKIGGE